MIAGIVILARSHTGLAESNALVTTQRKWGTYVGRSCNIRHAAIVLIRYADRAAYLQRSTLSFTFGFLECYV